MNWNRLLIAIVAVVIEKSYFGWHPWPQSDAELIADLICMLLIALAYPHRRATSGVPGTFNDQRGEPQ